MELHDQTPDLTIRDVKLLLRSPLVPQGLEHTDGELVLRYLVSNEVNSSTIGYPTVAAALADLHSKPEVQFRDEHGWTIAEDSSHHTFWSFPPPGSRAYPAAVQRVIVQGDTGISLKLNILCESTQSACDKLVVDFQALNQHDLDAPAFPVPLHLLGGGLEVLAGA